MGTPPGGHPEDPTVAIPEDNRIEGDRPAPEEDAKAIREKKLVKRELEDEPAQKPIAG